ncbi:Uncharacterised protein [Mycobacteroides abscessus subsp. abscessus]|nr:Uncharacterised protein [Mycobacteroides abscessus subsp. abscessus]
MFEMDGHQWPLSTFPSDQVKNHLLGLRRTSSFSRAVEHSLTGGHYVYPYNAILGVREYITRQDHTRIQSLAGQGGPPSGDRAHR